MAAHRGVLDSLRWARLSPTERQRERLRPAAQHESGHAIYHYLVGDPLHRVLVRPDGSGATEGTAGAIDDPAARLSLLEQAFAESERPGQLAKWIEVCLSGPAVCEAVWSRSSDRGAIAYAGRLYGANADERLAHHWRTVRALLAQDQRVAAAIEAVASLLMESRELSGADVFTLLDSLIADRRASHAPTVWEP